MFNKEDNVREQAEKRRADGHTVYTFQYSPVRASSQKLADCIEAVERAGWVLAHVSQAGNMEVLFVFRASERQ